MKYKRLIFMFLPVLVLFFAFSHSAFATTTWTQISPTFYHTTDTPSIYSNVEVMSVGGTFITHPSFSSGDYVETCIQRGTPNSPVGTAVCNSATYSGLVGSASWYAANRFNIGWYAYYLGITPPTDDYFTSIRDTTTDIGYYATFHWDSSSHTGTPTETCFDRIENQDETSVDVGGVCTVSISSNIITSTTWDKYHTYVVSGDIELTNGNTLTVQPGTVVKFDSGSSLTINGTLNAIGVQTTSEVLGEIFFTSLSEDIHGDTNGDNHATSPAPGDWDGIIIGSTGVATFHYATVRYGGNGTFSSQVYNDGGTLVMENSNVVRGTGYGVYNYSGASDISTTELGFNPYGFYLAGGTASITANNIIHDNSTYGIYNATSSDIHAEENFWGNEGGPCDSCAYPELLGDKVSAHVLYNDWRDDFHFTSGTGSVDDYEIRWGGSTQYSDAFDDAVDTWNLLGNVNIAPDTIYTVEDLTLSDIDENDIIWAAAWTPSVGADDIRFNEHFMRDLSTEEKQNTITHELGHALGLQHSYTGNVMYFMVSGQIDLGTQDLLDYYHLWP